MVDAIGGLKALFVAKSNKKENNRNHVTGK
jgi:hypothetical protein